MAVREDAVARRGAASPRGRSPGAAAENPQEDLGSTFLRQGISPARFGTMVKVLDIRIRAPLGDISVHVMEAKGVGPKGIDFFIFLQ